MNDVVKRMDVCLHASVSTEPYRINHPELLTYHDDEANGISLKCERKGINIK